MASLGGARLIRGVGFDLGETLVDYGGVPLDWQRLYPVALQAVGELWGEDVTAKALASGVDVLTRFNTRRTPREREVPHTVVFGELLIAMGVDRKRAPELIESAAEAFFAVFQRTARAAPGALETVACLRGAGVAAGVLSDVPYGMPRRLVLDDLRRAGLESLAASTLTSVDVGVRKPCANGFLKLASTLRCSPDEMVYVGNEHKDVAGANAAGMRSVLLWRSKESAPSWGQDRTIGSLDELLA